MEEIWKDIDGFEGIYQVSSKGNVVSLKRSRIIRMRPDRTMYAILDLSKNGKIYKKAIHRLVAEAFIENPNNYPQVNHKNGVKTDNVVENLEWCTVAQNFAHKHEVLGHRFSNCKLTTEQVLEIRETPEYYGYRRDLAKKFSVNVETIGKIKSYQTNKDKNSRVKGLQNPSEFANSHALKNNFSDWDDMINSLSKSEVSKLTIELLDEYYQYRLKKPHLQNKEIRLSL